MKTHYCVLEQDALLHIIGPDSLTFLQGQTSCDTQTVNASQAVNGVYCNVKGRVVCDFLLCELGNEHFGLRMRRAIREDSAAVFGKYVIFSKATLDASRDDWKCIAIWGEDAKEQLEEVFPALPARRYEAASGEGYNLIQLDEAATRFECMLDSESNAALLNSIENKYSAGTESDWQAQEIRAGVARIEPETVEEYVPQILNYDLTEHLNFKKGCYTGQEVVARLHYRGTPKRRSYLASYVASLESVDIPKAGTSLYGASGEQSVGNVINSASWQGQVIALVAATAEGAANGLHLENSTGTALTLGELPYSIEPAESA